MRLALTNLAVLRTAVSICWLAMLICRGVPAQGQTPKSAELTNELSLRQGVTNEPIRQIGPGIFEIGRLRLDQGKRTVTFPAVVNLREGPIEYVLVTDYGKIHESLLRTEVNPYSIQAALLLLGAIPPTTNGPAGTRSQVLTGSRIGIEISWTVKNRVRRKPVGNFVWDRSAKSRVGKGKWYFCGSSFRTDGFAAQLDGSIITVIDDGDAIIGSQARNREDDDNWLARGSGLPPADSNIDVVLSIRR